MRKRRDNSKSLIKDIWDCYEAEIIAFLSAFPILCMMCIMTALFVGYYAMFAERTEKELAKWKEQKEMWKRKDYRNEVCIRGHAFVEYIDEQSLEVTKVFPLMNDEGLPMKCGDDQKRR